MPLGTPTFRAVRDFLTWEAGTPTITVPVGGIPAGSTVFVVAGSRSADNPTACSDNGPGLTWTKHTNVLSTSERCCLFRAYAPAGLAAGVVITTTGAGWVGDVNAKVLMLGSFSGEGAVHQISSVNTADTAAAWSSGATPATSIADCVAVGFSSTANVRDNSNQSGSNPAFAEICDEGSHTTLVVTEAHGIASGTAVTAAGTWDSPATRCSGVVVFSGEEASPKFVAVA